MKGQTLIEVLVALAIAVVVISAVTVTSISSLSSAQYIKSQDQAAKYAQEGMETVRSIRNSNYASFRTSYGGVNGTIYCLGKDQTTLSVGTCTTPNIDGIFIRTVKIQQDDCALNVARVTVNVAYTSGKCSSGTYCESSKLVSCLSTVDPVSGP